MTAVVRLTRPAAKIAMRTAFAMSLSEGSSASLPITSQSRRKTLPQPEAAKKSQPPETTQSPARRPAAWRSAIRAQSRGLRSGKDALREVDAFFRREHRVIVPLTVRDILEESLARKLA
jgi:hypothetical protein